MPETSTHNTPPDVLLHVTDLHFWEVVKNPFLLLNKRFIGNLNVWLRRRHAYHTDLAGAFAETLRDTGVSTILLGGDFTSTATNCEFEQALRFANALKEHGLEVLAIPGNHDVYTFEARRARRFERHFEAFLPPEPLPCRVRLPNGAQMVLAPTVCPNLLSSRGRITPQEIERCAALVADAPPGPVLVAAHYPVLNDTPAYHTSRGRSLRNAERLRAALGETGRQLLYIAGHVHRFSHVQDNTWPAVSHLCTGALFHQHPGGHAYGGFSEIHVDASGFAVYRHAYGGSWSRAPFPAAQAQRS